MQEFFNVINAINGVMLGVPMLLALLAVGLIFTIWTRFCQYRSLTHGVGLLTGRWTGSKGEGAISHFQALSAALSATVGLGNIAGVAIAVELGGPGAVFWMWLIGLVGMALKTTEVTLSMLYRDTSDPNNPHGGTMWVAKRALPELSGRLKQAGPIIGALFTLPLILFALTGGNMFQAWSVSDTTHAYFGVEPWISGVVLAVIVGLVILGGIRRIGLIAGTLVPLMCVIYVIAGLFVIFINRDVVPEVLALIFTSAFSPAEATGAFVGASFGTAFIFGMKRALFSSEAGLGSAPIAHSAVKTKEPVTEGVVAGLEPEAPPVVSSRYSLRRGKGKNLNCRLAVHPVIAKVSSGEQRRPNIAEKSRDENRQKLVGTSSRMGGGSSGWSSWSGASGGIFDGKRSQHLNRTPVEMSQMKTSKL